MTSNELDYKRGAAPGVGTDYENCVTSLLSLRLSQQKKQFELGVNIDGLGKFDDVTITLKNNDKVVNQYLIQLKHVDNESKKLSASKLDAKSGDFSIEKYLKSYLDISNKINKKCNLILYTNLQCHSMQTTFFKVEKEDTCCELLKMQKSEVFKLQPNEQFVNKFEDKEKLNTFFKKFRLYTKQGNVLEVKNEIQRIFSNEFKAFDVCYQYCDYVNRWLTKDRSLIKNKIVPSQPMTTREYVDKWLCLTLLKPYLLRVEFEEDQCLRSRWNVLKKAASKFQITIFDSVFLYEYEYNFLKETIGYACVDGSTPSIVKIDENNKATMLKVLKHCKNPLIWFTSKNCDISQEISGEITFLSNLKDLRDKQPDVHNELIQFFKLSKIEQYPVEWFSKLNIDEITVTELFEINNVPKIFKQNNDYLERNFQISYFNMKSIERMIQEHFIIICYEKERTEINQTRNKIHQWMTKPLILENLDCEESKFCKNSLAFIRLNQLDKFIDRIANISKSCLVFTIKNDNFHLLLGHKIKIHKLKSDDVINVLDKTMLSDNFLFLNIISADPGMGKTYTLKWIHSEYNKINHFSKIIDLKRHDRFLKQCNNSSKEKHNFAFFAEIMKLKNKSSFEQLQILHHLSNGTFILLFDGVDEIDPALQEKSIKFIYSLKQSFRTIKIWISSRNHLKNQLEDGDFISVPSFTFNPLSTKEREKYIEERLKCKNIEDEDIQEFSKLIFDNEIVAKHTSELLGIPLMLYLQTENFISIGTCDKNAFTLTNIFKAYLFGSENHFRNKIRKPILSQEYDDYFTAVALRLCLGEELFASLETADYDESVKEIKENYLLRGLVLQFTTSNLPIFFHRTFAEYLTACYFVKHLNNCRLILQANLFRKEFETIKLFIDLTLAEDCTVHCDIIYKNYATIDQTTNLNETDDQKRTLLHVLVSNGPRFIGNNPHPEDISSHINALRKLTNVCGLHQKDNFLCWSPIEYAEASNNLSVINELIKAGFYTVNQNQVTIGNLFVSCKFDFSFIFKENFQQIVTKNTELFSMYHEKLIILAVENNSIENLKLLFKFGKNINLAQSLNLASLNGYKQIIKLLIKNGAKVKKGDNRGWTALMAASENGHMDVVELLLKLGAQVNQASNEGWTALMIASQHGHMDVVELLLKMGAQVNQANNEGWTALLIASRHGHMDVVELLLKLGAQVNQANNEGWTALMIASQHGHMDVVELLLKLGAQVNQASNEGWTALMIASENGHMDVVELLLKLGAQVNQANKKGLTALLQASQNGHMDVVELLLKLGAQVNQANNDGWTALMIASRHGHMDVVELLLKLGAQVNQANKKGLTALLQASQNGHMDVVELLLKLGAQVNQANNDGWTALMIASRHGHMDVVELLLKLDAQVNQASNEGWTALMIASRHGHMDVVELLLKLGAQVNQANKKGLTALLQASQNGHMDVVELLLKLGAQVNQANNDGWTALMIASRHGHMDVVELLLKLGAQVNQANKKGLTALLQASQNGHMDVVELLLKLGAQVNQANNDGWTALMIASRHGHMDVVELLLKLGAQVNQANKKGLTALLQASQNGHMDVVELLLKLGAQVNQANNDGWTALMIASRHGHMDVVELLLKLDAQVNQASNEGWTALMIASRHGHMDVVELLLKLDAQVNQANNEGWTALMIASRHGHMDVVELLLKLGAQVNQANKKGLTALLQASQNGHMDVVELLLKLGAQVNQANNDGWTALMIASRHGHMDVVELLLKLDAQVNQASNEGWTALMIASRHGHMDVVELLLKLDAQVNQASNEGWTALMIASRHGHMDVVELLLKMGAQVNQANNEGWTALMIASRHGHMDVVELLLKLGAQVNQASNEGWTTLLQAS